jgi:hypothetical protein
MSAAVNVYGRLFIDFTGALAHDTGPTVVVAMLAGVTLNGLPGLGLFTDTVPVPPKKPDPTTDAVESGGTKIVTTGW